MEADLRVARADEVTYFRRALVKDVRERLIAVARRKGAVTYFDVAQWAAFPTADGGAWDPLRKLLNRISTEEHKAGRPLLTVLVVRAKEGTPGDGFYRLARRLKLTDGSSTDCYFFLKRETARVYSFWASRPEAPAPPPPEVR